MDFLPVFNQSLSLDVARGILINIGMDPVIRLEDNFILSKNLIAHLHRQNFVVLQHVWKLDKEGLFHWQLTEDL